MHSSIDPAQAEGASLLVVAEDGAEWVLGRPDLRRYVAVPKPGAVFVQALQAGCSLDDATARASTAAGAPVDGVDFLSGLAQAGLLDPPGQPSPPDDAPVERPTGGRRTRQIGWIEGVRPEVARRLFGPVAWGGYLSAALLVGVLLGARPDLRPTFEHAWFLTDPVLSVLVFIPVGFALAAAHEAWHWLAGRAIGIPATFRVSYRAAYLVFETDLTQLVATSRRRRYGPFLAGMAFDVTVLALALVARLGHREDLWNLPAVLDRFLGAVVLFEILGIAWQCGGIFLRSDMYAVLANALRCHNLYRATWLVNKARLWGLDAREQTELENISPHDRSVARWFGLVYLAGMIAVFWLLLTFQLRFLLAMGTWVVHNLLTFTLTDLVFWESVAVVAYLIVMFGGPPALAVRERRLRRAGRLR
ncbi:hypothetical protein AB0873_21205 [Micromonospora sp. NPDC047707]|uniref:hypothetical protein n=1 Tax=Micromonospora sp. NPDC047707 TaxID=3154498 RepID=UPI003453D174